MPRNAILCRLMIPIFTGEEKSDACMSNDQCDASNARFCIITKEGVQPCGKTNPKWCDNEAPSPSFKYCPVDESNHCAATVKNHSLMWFRLFEPKNCPQGKC